MPFSRKRMTGKEYYEVQPTLKPGMVFLSHTRGEFTNLLIPGFWGHSALYVGNNEVLEATGAGVVRKDLISFLMAKDYVLAVYPEFAVESQIQRAIRFAASQLGKPYDYHFEFNLTDNKAYYCSELIWAAYHHALDKATPLIPRERMGQTTYSPEDVAEDMLAGIWSFVWSNCDDGRC
jgi:uncharacterized protein YycO